MEQIATTNGKVKINGKIKSRSKKNGSAKQSNISTFDPMKYMLKLPKNKKVKLPNGAVKWEKTEADYLPVAARIAWFRRENPFWSIITEIEQLADKAVLMKATIKDMDGTVIATARKKEAEAFLITSRRPRQEL
jgi:hypothetical protein